VFSLHVVSELSYTLCLRTRFSRARLPVPVLPPLFFSANLPPPLVVFEIANHQTFVCSLSADAVDTVTLRKPNMYSPPNPNPRWKPVVGFRLERNYALDGTCPAGNWCPDFYPILRIVYLFLAVTNRRVDRLSPFTGSLSPSLPCLARAKGFSRPAPLTIAACPCIFSLFPFVILAPRQHCISDKIIFRTYSRQAPQGFTNFFLFFLLP